MARIVIKLGTSTLTSATPHLSRSRMVDLVRQICELRAQNHEIVLVSSGAMAAGRETLDFPQLPRSIPGKQMLSAVGQPRLMGIWGQLFKIYDVFVAQVLLTRADLTARRRYLNARNALWALLQQDVVPIINENDTVATEEIRVGDNDTLSALVATLIHADTLIILTDQPGLFTDDPRKNPSAALIHQVDSLEIPPELWEAAGSSGELGVGGMQTKLYAADLARRAGTSVVIADGAAPDILLKVVAGNMIGTRFQPTATRLESFKRFILSGGESGWILVDQGAVTAIEGGGSLLAAGITAVDGDFKRGAAVRILDPAGDEIARGLVNYEARDCSQLIGRNSSEIDEILGFYYGDEIVHRGNMVLLRG